MCSNSKWDMAELLNGPVGNLVGMGIKAFVNGAPIGPRTSGMQKNSQCEKTKEFYDNVGAHLNGALQILGPAMEIKKILSGECKSANHERSVEAHNPAIQYYAPQNSKKSQSINNPNRCCACKKPENRSYSDTSKSSKMSYSSSRCNDTSALGNCKINLSKEYQQREQSSCSCKKHTSKMSSASMTSETSAKSCGAQSDKKCSKSSDKSSRLSRVCYLCKITLKHRILAVLPCDHVFCYNCLAKFHVPRCPSCNKPFDFKDIVELQNTSY